MAEAESGHGTFGRIVGSLSLGVVSFTLPDGLPGTNPNVIKAPARAITPTALAAVARVDTAVPPLEVAPAAVALEAAISVASSAGGVEEILGGAIFTTDVAQLTNAPTPTTVVCTWRSDMACATICSSFSGGMFSGVFLPSSLQQILPKPKGSSELQ
jgi:hypothetical protein